MVREGDGGVVGIEEGSDPSSDGFFGDVIDAVVTIVDEWDTDGENMGPPHVLPSVVPGELRNVAVTGSPLLVSRSGADG